MIRKPLNRLAAVCLLTSLLTGCSQPPYSPPTWESGGTGETTATTPAPSQYAAVPAHPTRRGPLTSWVTGQPLIRVRIAANQTTATIAAASSLQISPNTPNPTTTRTLASPITVTCAAGGFVIRSPSGNLRWNLPQLRITATSGASLAFNKARYPAALVLTPLTDDHHRPTNRLDIVNQLALERYLPGVIARELYPHWSLTAFKAQAIAARSYAIYEISLHQRRHYDVSSTTASQVYGGSTTNPTAQRAVTQTFGQCLTYQGRVVPAFFSSTCGGRSQDANAAFPNVVPIPPLAARQRDDFCQPSPKFRWATIVRDRVALSRRIALWGADNQNAVANLSLLTAIRITTRSASGRPAAFTLYDNRGQSFTLPCEWFRFACDHNVPRLPASQRLPSSDCVPIVYSRTVQFTQGRGFGHGVGLCQWGAHVMAERGYRYRAILSYAYPGAAIEKLY